MESKVVVFGNIKGGVGKSTLCANLAVALAHKFKKKILIIDLDKQSSISYFIEKRESLLEKIPKIFFEKANQNFSDETLMNLKEKKLYLEEIFNKHADSKFIIIDTAGSENVFAGLALYLADVLVTPITDSIIDINTFIKIGLDNEEIKAGPYASFVFEHQRQRVNNSFKKFSWLLVRNRVSPLISENKTRCMKILEKVSNYVKCNISSPIMDRVIYKDSFNFGLGIFDLPVLTNLTITKLKAYEEMDKFSNHCLNLCENEKDFIYN